jgi:transcriptional regulator with XRE-family HTH domain
MTWFFGEYLQRLIDEKDWTASKLAKKAKLSHVYMGHLLRGDRTEGDKLPRISVETVTALAKALEIPEYQLLLAYKGIDPMQNKPYDEEGFNLYAEIYAAAAAHGVNLDEMEPEARHCLENSVIRLSRRFICLIVDEELGRLKRDSSSS